MPDQHPQKAPPPQPGDPGFRWSPNDHRRCMATEYRKYKVGRTLVQCSLQRGHEGPHLAHRTAFGVKTVA